MSSQESIAFEKADDTTVARIHLSELTSKLADTMLARVTEMLDAHQPPKLVVDLASVKFIDSIALGTLVVLLRRVKENDGRLALAGLSGHALKVLQVTGLEKVFDLFSSVPAALENLRQPS